MDSNNLGYADYVRLTNSDSIRDRFSNHQWVCLNKWVRGLPLSASDRRVLRMSGLVDSSGNATLIGNVCFEKIKKSLKKRNKSVKRGKLKWEQRAT